MAIDPHDIEHFEDQLRRAGVSALPACPVCDGVDWRTNAALRLPVADRDFDAAAVEVMCGRCGYLLLFGRLATGASDTTHAHADNHS